MSEKTSAEVVIGGKMYTLGGYEGEDYLQKVAAYINNKLSEFESIENYRRFPADMKAVMIHLNIADDYFKAKSRAEQLERELETKEKELYDLKHELISHRLQEESNAKEMERLEQENQELLLNKARLETTLESALLDKASSAHKTEEPDQKVSNFVFSASENDSSEEKAEELKPQVTEQRNMRHFHEETEEDDAEFVYEAIYNQEETSDFTYDIEEEHTTDTTDDSEPEGDELWIDDDSPEEDAAWTQDDTPSEEDEPLHVPDINQPYAMEMDSEESEYIPGFDYETEESAVSEDDGAGPPGEESESEETEVVYEPLEEFGEPADFASKRRTADEPSNPPVSGETADKGNHWQDFTHGGEETGLGGKDPRRRAAYVEYGKKDFRHRAADPKYARSDPKEKKNRTIILRSSGSDTKEE